MAKSKMPIQKALEDCRLTPPQLTREINAAYKDASGELCSKIRDEYVKCVEKIPLEEFKDPRHKQTRDEMLRFLKRLDLTKASQREIFFKYIYNFYLAATGNRVYNTTRY